MVHDRHDVTRLRYRSVEPLLEPTGDGERCGIVPNVVFPTAIDVRPDGDADVFYGMADSRIGMARLHLGSAAHPRDVADRPQEMSRRPASTPW